MYMIHEFTIKLDLATYEKTNTTFMQKLYFKTLEEAQKYVIKYLVQVKDMDYNKNKILKNKKENTFYSDFTTIDNKYKYYTNYEIIKIEKFKGVL